MIAEHFNKKNLHHAYLIEGEREGILAEIWKLLEDLGIKTTGNPDFIEIKVDTLKIDEARNLKSLSGEKGFSVNKKIFIVATNTILLEAQQSLLKMFEEPIENTHFFIIVPDANTLLKTLISRFYFISANQNLAEEIKIAEKFIQMPIAKRLEFIKELLEEEEDKDEEGNEILALDSNRSKALKFLNALETVLSQTILDVDTNVYSHVFKVREFLRMPGSSVKTLMESVALVL